MRLFRAREHLILSPNHIIDFAFCGGRVYVRTVNEREYVTDFKTLQEAEAEWVSALTTNP